MVYWLVVSRVAPTAGSDFDQLWDAARALRAGGDPYTVVRAGAMGPARVYLWDLYYPLPAVLTVLPFSFLPMALARGVFSACVLAPMAYVLARKGGWALLPLLSAPAFLTLSLAQWNGVVALAVLVPWVGALAGAGKPNAYAAIVAGKPLERGTWYAIAAAAVIAALSFLILPTWFASWLTAVRSAPHFTPLVFRAGGVLLLLAAFRWRDARARWLLATAVIPATPILYAALPLLLYDGWSRRETLTLCLLSHAAMWVGLIATRNTTDFVTVARTAGTATIWLVYLPAVALILRGSRGSRAGGNANFTSSGTRRCAPSQ